MEIGSRQLAIGNRVCRSMAVAVLVAGWAGASSQTASAQNGGGYDLSWSVDGSGFSISAGSGYVLGGVVGLSDGREISGNGYSVGEGFWPLPSVAPPESVAPDPSGMAKTRFISFVMPASSTDETAIRVRLSSLHHVIPPYTGGPSTPFTSFEGQVRWVGAPVQYVESGASGVPFHAAQLQCDPHYQDWSTVGLVHVTGSAIVPSSIYEVENVAASCAGMEASCTAVSAPLSISTTRWGDVETPYNPPSPTVQPDISDVSALVDKFRSAPGAPIKARALLAGEPGNPFGEITPAVLGVDFGFSHISACVDAFRGVPYPYTIQACP